MTTLRLERLMPEVAEKVKPFLEEILEKYPGNVHSIHVVGSAVTADFAPKTSDINSLFVLKEMDLKFLELIAPLGKKYKKRGLAAPLIMTPEYLRRSLDVFPIEFMDFKLIHETVLGEDLLATVEIGRDDLRHQCEREIKSKLIWLRQGYLSSQGDRRSLTEGIVSPIAGYMSLFRGIVLLMGNEPPVEKQAVIAALADATGINTDIFRRVLELKKGTTKPGKDELDGIFEEYYAATEQIGKVIDELQC